MAPTVEKSLTRLLLGHELVFLLLIVVTGVLGGAWVYFWQQASQESVRINALLYAAQQLRADLYRQVREVHVASRAQDPHVLDIYWKHIYDIDRAFYRLETHTHTDAETRSVREMRNAYEMMQAEMNKLLAAPPTVTESQRRQIIEPAYESWLQGAFEQALGHFNQLIGKRQADLNSRLTRANRAASWALPIPLLVALGILVYSHRNLRARFSSPMRDLERGAQQISLGHLAHRVPEHGVAEVSKLAQAINKMANDLAISRDALVQSERQAALGALVPVVAHNIRNPLASIRATAQTIDDVEDEQELIEAKRAIIATVDRLERWVSSLLSYLNPLEPHRQITRLSRVADDALALLESKCKEKDVTIERRNWDVDHQIAVDTDLLEQAIHGLVLNALEATPGHSKIHVNLEANQDDVALIIADEGPGMIFNPDPKDLTPGPTTKRSGTGLGIPFAHKVCQVHGGNLGFVSIPGNGTRARITLPKDGASPAA